MPGLGGGGGGGGFGGGGGGFGGGEPGGLGGFGGEGIFSGPGGGLFGPGYGGPMAWWPFYLSGANAGPWGLPWCWWPVLVLFLPYMILVIVGIVVIQALDLCSEDATNDDKIDTTGCFGYEVVWAVGLALLMCGLFCCCFCAVRGKEREGTPAEQAPILATEAPPPVQTYSVEPTAPEEDKSPTAPTPVSTFADKSA